MAGLPTSTLRSHAGRGNATLDALRHKKQGRPWTAIQESSDNGAKIPPDHVLFTAILKPQNILVIETQGGILKVMPVQKRQ